MKDLLLVIIGGFCSAFGGFFAAWYRAKMAGTIRLQETIAERKVAAYGKGLELIGQIQSVLIQGTEEDALKFIESHGSWFADNLILLPHTFVENWRSIRLNLRSAIRTDKTQEKMGDDAKREAMIDDVVRAIGFRMWETSPAKQKPAYGMN